MTHSRADAEVDPNELPPLSEAQLEVMHAVWAGGEVTVTDVWNMLTTQRPIARNTVLTVMDRLASKGWLIRRASGQSHLYRAAVSKAKALGSAVRRLVDVAFEGSAEELVLALVDGRGLSEEEARRIRKLIADAKKSGGRS
jgi:BlaI family penicillinase repressor